MALHVYDPGTFRDDFGDQHKLYPVPEDFPEPDLSTIMYDRQIQKAAQIQSNIVDALRHWILSFFPAGYFKMVRVRTESNYSAFKSFMKNIYKVEKPFMVIDPQTIEQDEDSIFGQNMINRYNMIDPEHDNIGAKLLYSIDLMKSDMFQLVYRRNRYRFEFDIMIMEQTMDRQINTYNMLLMNIRHNSKFLLERTIPQLIPSRYIQNIAKLHGFSEVNSEEFLTFLNSISTCPIIKRTLPNGLTLFYMQQTLNLQVEVPSVPSKDSPETSNAFEWGARIQDSFTIRADLPSEFLFLLPQKYMTKYDRSIPDDPEKISMISPIYADLDWPKEINGYTLTNRVDIMLSEDDEKTVNLIPIVANYNEDIYKILKECVDKSGTLSDLMMVRVYPNGSYTEASATFSEEGILTMLDPEVDKLYTVNIYLNLHNINLIHEGKHKKFIGTIQQY